jgi:hypothetical protein
MIWTYLCFAYLYCKYINDYFFISEISLIIKILIKSKLSSEISDSFEFIKIFHNIKNNKGNEIIIYSLYKFNLRIGKE